LSQVRWLFLDVQKLLERGNGHRMVEVQILIEPLDGEWSLISIQEGSIDGCQVLEPSLSTDEGVSRFLAWGIAFLDGKWEPSLLQFRINGGSKVVVFVDQGQHLLGHGILPLQKSVQEDDLQVAVPAVKVLGVLWRRFST